MWPKLSPDDKPLTVLPARQSSVVPQQTFVFFDAGMVLIDLDWDAFLEGLAQHYDEGGFSPESFQHKVVSSGLLGDWECGRIGPSLFVARLRDLMSESQSRPGSLHTVPSMLDVKRLSSMILGDVRRDVLRLVEDLKAQGFGTGVLSNASPWHETDLRQKTALDALFDVVLFSQDMGYAKPDPQIYRQAAACAQDFGARAGRQEPYLEFLFLDDTPANVRAARTCGWSAVLVDLLKHQEHWAHPELEHLSRRKSHLVFGQAAADRIVSQVQNILSEGL